MRTETISIYGYDELSDKAKEKARAWWRHRSHHDTDWSGPTIEEAKDQGVFLGLNISNIFFRGFWSQGDGACFEGSWNAAAANPNSVADGWGESPATTELLRIAAEFKKLARRYPTSSFTVKHSGSYSQEYCTDFDVHIGDEDSAGMHAPEYDGMAEKELMAAARQYMRWIYRQLEAAYDDWNSDEHVAGEIISNDHEFTADGRPYR